MQEETLEVSNKIEYFPFLRAFFCDDGVYDALTEKAKMEHARRLWQLLARAQPEFMQAINNEHNVHVMDAIHAASKSLGKQPAYCYIKADAPHSKYTEKINAFDRTIKQEFKRSQDIDEKDFQFFAIVEPVILIEALEQIKEDYDNSKSYKKTKK